MNVIDSEKLHSKYCANRSAGIAITFLAICTLLAMNSWRSLESFSRPDRGLIDFVARLVSIVFLVQLLKAFQCARERLVVGIYLGNQLMWFVYDYAFQVGVLRQLRFVNLLMWVLAAILSASMLVSTVRASKPRT